MFQLNISNIAFCSCTRKGGQLSSQKLREMLPQQAGFALAHASRSVAAQGWQSDSSNFSKAERQTERVSHANLHVYLMHSECIFDGPKSSVTSLGRFLRHRICMYFEHCWYNAHGFPLLSFVHLLANSQVFCQSVEPFARDTSVCSCREMQTMYSKRRLLPEATLFTFSAGLAQPLRAW